MNARNDPKDAADRLEENVACLRTLFLAAEDKIQFHISNKSLLGPYRELLSLYVAELGNLLALAEQLVEKIDEDVETVTDTIFKADLSCAVKKHLTRFRCAGDRPAFRCKLQNFS